MVLHILVAAAIMFSPGVDKSPLPAPNDWDKRDTREYKLEEALKAELTPKMVEALKVYNPPVRGAQYIYHFKVVDISMDGGIFLKVKAHVHHVYVKAPDDFYLITLSRDLTKGFVVTKAEKIN